MKKNFIKISLMIFLAIFASTALFFSKPKQTKAFLGFGDIVSINLDDLWKSIAFTAADAVTQHFVSTYLNKAMVKFKIQDYNSYAQNLSSLIFMRNALKNKSAIQQYVTRVVSSQENGNPVSAANLAPLFTQSAMNHFNVYQAAQQTYSGTPMLFTLNHAGDLASNPGIALAMAESEASKINQQSMDAAKADIANSQGYKSTYQCYTSPNSNSAGQFMQKESCIVNNPGNYISSEIHTWLQTENQQKTNPPNHATVGWEIFSDNLARNLLTKLFDNYGNSVIGDISNASNPLVNLVIQSTEKPQFYLVDANGNKITSAGSATTGSQVTLFWDASKVLNASYVTLSETPFCSNQCPPVGNSPINGSYSFTYDGNADSFTLATFTEDASGNAIQKFTNTINIIPK